LNRSKYICRSALAICLVFSAGTVAMADSITEFTSWTLVEDPPSPNMSAIVNNPSQITLTANALVLNATDIGYQSVDGQTAATSTSGFAFDPASDFSLAADYDFSFLGLTIGGLVVGFGIGEDSDGMNSAGAIVATTHSAGLLTTAATGAARTNDINHPLQVLSAPAPLTGSFFASYEALSGDITVGTGAPGAVLPTTSTTFSNIQQGWTGANLFPSLFLRSEHPFGSGWNAGTGVAVFGNPRVLSGTPISVVIPEPATLTLAILGCLGMHIRTRRRRPPQ